MHLYGFYSNGIFTLALNSIDSKNPPTIVFFLEWKVEKHMRVFITLRGPVHAWNDVKPLTHTILARRHETTAGRRQRYATSPGTVVGGYISTTGAGLRGGLARVVWWAPAPRREFPHSAPNLGIELDNCVRPIYVHRLQPPGPRAPLKCQAQHLAEAASEACPNGS